MQKIENIISMLKHTVHAMNAASESMPAVGTELQGRTSPVLENTRNEWAYETNGYIRTKKELKNLLSRLEVDEMLTLAKPRFWCRDTGYHYNLIVRREDENTYVVTFTDYHAVYSNHPRLDLIAATNVAWRWIKRHGTRKYFVD